MKKLVSVIALCAVVTPAFSATKAARPSYLSRNSNGGYDVTYKYTDKEKSGWYASLRAELALLNWENKYSSDVPSLAGGSSDKYSFEALFAPNFAFGKRFNYFWRAEVEAGYITKFTDEDEGYKFTLSVPYLMANGYYDFSNGLYLGAGVGVAFPMTELIDDAFVSGGGKETGVSPMGALMVGFAHTLDDNIVLDVRYRLGGFWGTEQKRTWTAGTTLPELGDVSGKYLENKIGLILDNSISVGIRYEF